MDLSWTASASLDTEGYQLVQSQQGTAQPGQQINSTLHQVTWLTTCTEYSFEVSPYDHAGESVHLTNMVHAIKVRRRTPHYT